MMKNMSVPLVNGWVLNKERLIEMLQMKGEFPFGHKEDSCLQNIA